MTAGESSGLWVGHRARSEQGLHLFLKNWDAGTSVFFITSPTVCLSTHEVDGYSGDPPQHLHGLHSEQLDRNISTSAW